MYYLVAGNIAKTLETFRPLIINVDNIACILSIYNFTIL